MKEFNTKSKELYSIYLEAKQSGDEAKIKEVTEKYNELYEEEDAYVKSYVNGNANCVVAAYIANRQMLYSISATDLDSLIGKFDPAIASSKYILAMNDFFKLLSWDS